MKQCVRQREVGGEANICFAIRIIPRLLQDPHVLYIQHTAIRSRTAVQLHVNEQGSQKLPQKTWHKNYNFDFSVREKLSRIRVGCGICSMPSPPPINSAM